MIAGFFLGLFLFIHAFKISHQHDSIQPPTKQILNSPVFSQTGDCSICDYHFTKDSFHVTEFPLIKKTGPAEPSNNSFTSLFISSIGFTSFDRGPPALV
jgi:hypothetical protein